MEINKTHIMSHLFRHSRLNPGVLSGLRSGVQIRSRWSPSSLVCPSIDSSLTGGDMEWHAGLEDSEVRKDSLAPPPPPDPGPDPPPNMTLCGR